MDSNNEEFFEIIGDKVFKMSGIESNEKWQECQRTNSSYRDCPISQYVSKSNLTMTVAVYNPSTIDINSVQIAVPNHNYKVKVWNQVTKSLVEPTGSVVNCYTDYNEAGDIFDSCFMTVNTLVKSRNVQVIVLDKVNNNSISLEAKTLAKNDFIENDRIKLSF